MQTETSYSKVLAVKYLNLKTENKQRQSELNHIQFSDYTLKSLQRME